MPRKKNNAVLRFFKPYIKGIIVFFIAFLILSLLSAGFYAFIGAVEGADKVLSVISCALAVFFDAFITAGTKGCNGMLAGAVSALVVFTLLLIISIISGGFSGEETALRLAVFLISGMTGGVIGVNLAKKTA